MTSAANDYLVLFIANRGSGFMMSREGLDESFQKALEDRESLLPAVRVRILALWWKPSDNDAASRESLYELGDWLRSAVGEEVSADVLRALDSFLGSTSLEVLVTVCEELARWKMAKHNFQAVSINGKAKKKLHEIFRTAEIGDTHGWRERARIILT